MPEQWSFNATPEPEREPDEKREIGELVYTVETTRKGKNRFDFSRSNYGFDVGFLDDKKLIEADVWLGSGYLDF